MNTYIYLIMLSFMKIILTKEDKKDTGVEKVDNKKDDTNPEEPNDGSVIVNQAGMQEVLNEDTLYNKIPFTPPKGKKSKTIKQVSVEAQKNHLSPVAALFAYADPQEINEIPSTIFSVSDILLKNNTESNEQQVTFGPEFDNSEKGNDGDKKDGDDKGKKDDGKAPKGNDKDKPEDNDEPEKDEGGKGDKPPKENKPPKKDEDEDEDKDEGGKKPDEKAGKLKLLEKW